MRFPVAIDAEILETTLATARQAIHLEAEGLAALADGLDGSFAALVEMIRSASGRVILSGVGKSAHIARKIAATLASTGTPAQFIHGADASHGDLGMIVPADIVVMFSKSGDTRELEDLANFCARFAIPLALVTANPASRLGKAANLVIQLPAVDEACDITAAPTTSTTMMAALGDALAVVLLRQRGFRAADFHVLHPGGALGGALLSVGEVMHKGDELPLVTPDAVVSHAILEMTSKGFGCTGVVDEGGFLIGIVTDGDLRRHMSANLLSQPVGAVMTPAPKAIEPEALLSEALRRMTVDVPKVTALFAVSDGIPVGIVHLHDCLRVGAA